MSVRDRHWMVERQIRARGVRDARVLLAMEEVPREEFVELDQRDLAHTDGPLPIGLGQTISQPFTVAYMVEALRLCGDEKVLEVGTGSGYGAAVLSRLAREVHSIERHAPLAQQAAERLQRLGIGNVQVHVGDGSLGLRAWAPFDAICVTAAAFHVPMALCEQLADGGRLVIPVGGEDGQRLLRLTRRGAEWVEDDLGGFAFVPLIGAQGWPEREGH